MLEVNVPAEMDILPLENVLLQVCGLFSANVINASSSTNSLRVRKGSTCSETENKGKGFRNTGPENSSNSLKKSKKIPRFVDFQKVLDLVVLLKTREIE